MQLRAEPNPALTTAQSVEHAEVVVPAASAVVETRASATGGQPFGQVRNLVFGGSVRQTNREVTEGPSIAVPAIDDAFLNRSASSARKSTYRPVQPVEEVRAAPIEVWEGEVKTVDLKAQTMSVYLRSKLGRFADHAGEIALEWVVEQDKDLVRPGAVFYWTLFKETRRSSVRNSQELRFRRVPNWSRAQIEHIRSAASKLFQNAKVARVFNDPAA